MITQSLASPVACAKKSFKLVRILAILLLISAGSLFAQSRLPQQRVTDPAAGQSDISIAQQGFSHEKAELPMVVDFNLFDGLNLHEIYPGWAQGKGYGAPQIMNSAWYRSAVLYETPVAGVTLDHIGLKDEWIISPPFVATEHTMISFWAALSRIYDDPTQGNFAFSDSVNLMVSMGGLDFIHTVHSFKAGNQPPWSGQDYMFSLGDFAGQTIRIAFYATNGQDPAGIKAFHLDDIVIWNSTQRDVRVAELVEPSPRSCFSGQQPILARIQNTGQQSVTAVPLRARIRGAMTTNLFASYDGILEPGEYAEVFMGYLENPPFGEYTFSIEAELPGDGVTLNDKKSGIQRTFDIPRELPLPFMNFIGFYSNNLGTVYPGWYEARGKDWPRVKMDTDWQGDNYDNARTANVYFTALGTEDWMIGPKFTASENLVLRMRAAVQYMEGTSQMGSDDKLAIMASPNCGQDWTEVAAFTRESGLSANLQEFSFPIPQFAGQDIILAFYATTGTVLDPQQYIFHITDIQIGNEYAVDAGVTHLLTPGNTCGFSDQEQVSIRVRNFGSTAISNFPVNYQLQGEPLVTETIGQSLAPGQSLDYSFSQLLDLSGEGPFMLSVYTSLGGDQNPENDGLFELPLSLSSHDLATQGTYTMGFEADEDFSNWLVEDGNNDGITWYLVEDPVQANSGDFSFAFFSNQSSSASNDWLISPCFYLEAGQSYQVSFYYKNRATNWPESLKLNLGTAQQGSAMSQLLIDLGQISNPTHQQAVVNFSVEESGEYYFGWHAYGPADQFGMHIDDIAVRQVFTQDLAVSHVKVPRIKLETDCELFQAEYLEVQLSNVGQQTMHNLAVSVSIDQGAAVVYDLPGSIDPGESAWFETGDLDVFLQPDQIYHISVSLVHPLDMNPVNDNYVIEQYLMQQFYTGFEATDDISEWTAVSLAGVNQWQLVQDASLAHTGNNSYGIRTDAAGGNNANDDWLISECFHLEEGVCYEIGFWYRSRFSTENLALYMGQGAAPANMETLLINLPEFNTNAYQFVSAQFTVEQSGVYHFGWHTQGGTSGRYFIYIDDVFVIQDLGSQPSADPTYVILDHEVAFFAMAENAQELSWDFGDGNTSELENPFHIYEAPGTYQVTLHMSSGCVSVSQSFSLELIIPHYEVRFEITDQLGNPVSDAVVTAGGQQADQGVYVFEFMPGGYPFSVSYEDMLVEGYFAVTSYDVNMLVVLPFGDDTHVDEHGLTLPGISVYPNPAGDYLNLQSEGLIQRLSLYNLSGQLVRSWPAIQANETRQLLLHGLAPGTYVLQAESAGNVQHIKIIRK